IYVPFGDPTDARNRIPVRVHVPGSGDESAGGRNRPQGWGAVARQRGAMAVGQVVPDIAALLTARRDDAEDAFGEAAADRTVRTATGLAPEHSLAHGPLGDVVGRFDTVAADEGPQPPLVGQQRPAGGC